jgi:outer membrane protein, heavy metal efflux system
VSVPFWNQARGSEEAAQARLNQAEVSITAAMRDLDRQIMTAADSYNQEFKELNEDTPQLLEQLRDAAKVADDNYRLGALPISTYTEIQLQYVDATDAVLSSRTDALQNLSNLEYLSGQALHDISSSLDQRNASRKETK